MEVERPPSHRHDGSSPLPLGLDACQPPARWTGRDTVWPHDPRSGWSYCAVVGSWTVLSAKGGPSTVDPNGTVYYRVQVAIQSPSAVSYMRGVLRRFSDFLKLHAALRKLYPKKRTPPPPPKNPLQRMNSNPALLEERRRALDDWMQQLLMDLDFSRSAAMAGFLELEAAARGAASSLSQDDSSASLSLITAAQDRAATVPTVPSHRFPSSASRALPSESHSPTSTINSTMTTPTTSTITVDQQRGNTTVPGAGQSSSQFLGSGAHLGDGSSVLSSSRPSSRSRSMLGSAPGSTAALPDSSGTWTVADELGPVADPTREASELEEAGLRSAGGGEAIGSRLSESEGITDGEVNALLDAEFGIRKGVLEKGGSNVGRVGGGSDVVEGVAKESSEGELLGILKNGWHRRTGSGGSENSEVSSFSGIGSEPSEISTPASFLGGDLAMLLAERERQYEIEGGGGGGTDGEGPRAGTDRGRGKLGGGWSGGDVFKGISVILPADHRTVVQRMLMVMQRRLGTAKADMEELLARLKQETATKEFLTSKVHDLEAELDDTRTKSREALLQVHMAEREKLTELQWALEEARVALRKQQEEKGKDKEERESAVQRAQAAESAHEELMEELGALRGQLEAAKQEREEMDAKARMEKRVLIKEVKSLRHAQVALKDEALAAISARDEAEKKLGDLEERMLEDEMERVKLVREVAVLRERLRECGELARADGEESVSQQASAELLEALTVSDQRIECILAETQLLREEEMRSGWRDSDDASSANSFLGRHHPVVNGEQVVTSGGKEMDLNGEAGGMASCARRERQQLESKSGMPEMPLRIMFTDILADNAHLRKVVNSLTRGVALSTRKT